MIFGPTPLSEAVGAILAHGTRHGGGMFKKGRVLSAADVAALIAAGHHTVVAARLSADDVPEDEAATRIAQAIAGNEAKAQAPFTGRCNIYSAAHGLLVVDEQRLTAINHLHESLTIATLPAYAKVSPRQMLATVKVIPFAVPRAVLDDALRMISDTPLLRVAAFQSRQVGLVISRLPQTKTSLIEKSETAIRERLSAIGSMLAETLICDHAEAAVSDAIYKLHATGRDPILVFGASAIVDRADVIPAAVSLAGGAVIHLGMPVDPGNLLMLARIGAGTVIGVPSCARSPKTNGFDWVLERELAGLDVSARDIMAMGVGGLLAEIPSRPTPREPKTGSTSAPHVAAVVLAAGTSSRMGSHKLLADFHGEPMIRATVRKVLSASVNEVVVVTGHEDHNIAQSLAGLPVRLVHNADYAIGLAASLKAGVAAVAATADCVIVCLADMPLVEGLLLDRLIAAYNPTEHRSIIVPVHQGQFGNPVLWGAEHFHRLMTLAGDKGARALIADLKSDAVEIEAGSDAILRDADTPAELDALRASAGLAR